MGDYNFVRKVVRILCASFQDYTIIFIQRLYGLDHFVRREVAQLLQPPYKAHFELLPGW